MNNEARIAELAGISRRAALAAGNTEAALGAGTMLGRILWQNPVGRLSDEPLEAALHERLGPSLATAVDPSRIRASPVDWLHVVSEAYDIGGHTQLLEALLAVQAGRQKVGVAVTISHTARFAARCAKLEVPLRLLKGGLADRASGLIALGRRAERVVLHIHPDDLGAALAARVLRNEGHEVVYLNHADHVFGFGHGAASVVAEVSGFGWRLTAERRSARRQHFLGIPVPLPPRQLAPNMAARAIAEGPILSIGSAGKYQPDRGLDFQAFLMTLMDRTDRPVELIGPRPEDHWWQPVLARHGNRLSLLGRLPYEEMRARLATASCYIDSFPVAGGTALTQGLMAGKTVFAPPYPAAGYSLADALRAPSVDAMTEQILAFLATGKEPAMQATIRDRIAAEFGTEAIACRLARLEQGARDPPPSDMLAAAQDLDYHTNVWRRSGRPIFAFPPLARPAINTRLALMIRAAGHGDTQWPTMPSFLRWALCGPKASWVDSP